MVLIKLFLQISERVLHFKLINKWVQNSLKPSILKISKRKIYKPHLYIISGERKKITTWWNYFFSKHQFSKCSFHMFVCLLTYCLSWTNRLIVCVCMCVLMCFILFICLFIYFWLRWVFVAARRLSLVAVSRGYSLLRCAGFSMWWLLLLWSTGSRCVGFSSCGAWAQ